MKLVIKAFRKTFSQENFDLFVYVPSTPAGDLEKDFAVKVSEVLNIPISHNLLKTIKTRVQKVLENQYLKTDNIKGSYPFITPNEIKGRNILLVDDIYDSGATRKEVGKLLTNF